MRRKIKQINAGAWGKVVIGVDSCGRFRTCSAGRDVFGFVNKIDVRKVVYVKVDD